MIFVSSFGNYPCYLMRKKQYEGDFAGTTTVSSEIRGVDKIHGQQCLLDSKRYCNKT